MKQKIGLLSLLSLLFLVSCQPGETSSSSPLQPSNSTPSVSSEPLPTSSSSSPVSTSTETKDKEVTLVYKAYPALLDSSQGTVSVGSDGYKLNSVFTLSSGVTIDFASGKTVSVDGIDLASGGRFKFNGKSDSDHLNQKSLKITTTGKGTFRFACLGANGSDTSRTYTISKGDGTELYTSPKGVSTASSSTPDFYTYEIPEANTYYLYSKVNGINFYYFDFTQKVELGDETGFALDTSALDTDTLIGEDISLTGLRVNATYSSGATLELESKDYTVDTSAFDKAKAGTYPIKVKYKNYPEQSFNVKVHAVKSIKAYYEVLQNGTGSKTVSRFPTVYKKNDTLDKTAIVVKATRDDDVEVNVTSKATITLPTTSEAGKKDVGISFINDSKTYEDKISITVLDSSFLTADSDGVYVVAVDSSITEEGTLSNNVLTFSSLQKAHDFLKTATSDDDKKKIAIKAGTYEEKVYIEIKNLTLNGEKGEDGTPSVTLKAAYDADSKDALGNPFSTYGSASVSVKESADAFHAENIVFSNSKFTSMAEYNRSNDSNKQAVALLCEADKSLFKNCSFKGYQDTLYARLHNQAYLDCKIEGMTDYVFGEDADILLRRCTLTSLYRNSDTNGGYVCAPKGGSSTTVGFVFDSCTIQGEESVVEGTVSLARPWAKSAIVHYLNCSMSNVVSKKAYGDTSDKKNARYESMSGNKPTDASFSEYGNTGDGAVSTAVSGMSLLSETEYNSLISTLNTTFDFVA